MVDEGSSVDTLSSINAFLACIGGSQVTQSQYEEHSRDSIKFQSEQLSIKQTVTEKSDCIEKPHDVARECVDQEDASPVTGKQTLPLTDMDTKSLADNVACQVILPSQDQTGVLSILAENLGRDLTHSKHAFSDYGGRLLHSGRRQLAIKSSERAREMQVPLLDGRKELMEHLKNVSYQDSVLQSFKNETAPSTKSPDGERLTVALEQRSTLAEASTTNLTVQRSLAPSYAQDFGIDDETGLSADTAPFPKFESNSPAPECQTTRSTSVTSSPTVVQPTDRSVTLPAEEAETILVGWKTTDKAEDVAGDAGDDAFSVGVIESRASPEEVGNRGYLTHFMNRGQAGASDAPGSRARKIVLENLPPNANNTLVASLLHGGTIEKYQIVMSSEKCSTKHAIVFFTEASAAQNYQNKYQTGIDFHLKGRRHTASVEIGTEPDVLPKIIEAQLEAGASRVVKVTDAAEEWDMRALRKLAEDRGRSLEGIQDNWRDEVRTIVFTFASIADSVQFRGQLKRNGEWKMCNIQFVDDPCLKATGVRSID